MSLEKKDGIERKNPKNIKKVIDNVKFELLKNEFKDVDKNFIHELEKIIKWKIVHAHVLDNLDLELSDKEKNLILLELYSHDKVIIYGNKIIDSIWWKKISNIYELWKYDKNNLYWIVKLKWDERHLPFVGSTLIEKIKDKKIKECYQFFVHNDGKMLFKVLFEDGTLKYENIDIYDNI